MKRLKLIGAMAAIASFAFLFSCGGGSEGGGGPKCELDVLFSAPTSGFTGQPITPTNSTLGDAVSYAWDFGDGTVLNASTAAAPTHSYATPGSYTIKLTAYCEAGQSGTSADYTSSITIAQADPTADFATFEMNLPDGSVVWPTNLLFRLINNSTQSSSYTIDWGDGTVENFSAAELANNGEGFTDHTYTDAATRTITATAYAGADQSGDSDVQTFDVSFQAINRFTATKFTLHPAFTDSLAGVDDGTNGPNDESDNSGADILMLFHEIDAEGALGLFLLTPLEAVLNDIETISSDIDINIDIQIDAEGNRQNFWYFYAPQNEWADAVNPIFQSGSLAANVFPPNVGGFAGVWDLDATDAGNFVGDIYDMYESDITGIDLSATSYTWRNTNGDPLVTMHFTVEEWPGF